MTRNEPPTRPAAAFRGARTTVGNDPSIYRDRRTRWQRRFRNARRRVVGWIVTPIAWTLPRAPRRALRAILRQLVGWPLWLAHRRAASENATRALGVDPEEGRRIAKASCFHLGTALAEIAWTSHHGFAAPDASVDDSDACATIRELESRWDRGWIGVTGHLGNWELLATWLRETVRSRNVTVIAKRAPNRHLNRVIERMRAKLGLDTLYQDESPARAVEVLRAGGVVGVVPDQDVKTISGMFVEFFDRPAYTPVGPARLAVAARVPIVCGFLVTTDTGYRVIVNTPIWPDESLPRAARIEALTRAWSEQVEAAIRELPAQWPWMHDRWRTTPEKLESKGRRTLQVG